MLLTGFDSKYLNTLYVDKNLKHHSLIQAFSRTNRVLNDTKPYGHILDFRGQQAAVDTAIALFSGKSAEQARQIWLVDKAPVVIEKLKEARTALDTFLKSQGLSGKPEDIANLKGDEARAGFIEQFKKVQKLQTQLDQYTDLTPEQEKTIQTILPPDDLQSFRGQYLETAQRLREKRETPGSDEKTSPAIDQLDFEFVLFASATIDYDYIIKLITDFQATGPTKSTMSREQLIGLIASDSKFIDERDTITEYVRGLKANEGLDEKAIRAGYQAFKDQKNAKELSDLAAKHTLPAGDLQSFVDTILTRKVFDGEQLTTLLAPLDLGWRARTQKELELMADLVPLLKKRAAGGEIAGLKVYEE
jgi:type I restriction enzyme R subunit